MPASQDFRDGAATALSEMRARLAVVVNLGIPLTVATVDALALTLAAEYGGKVMSAGRD